MVTGSLTKYTRKEIEELIKKNNINVIAIGNGTASRESEKVVSEIIKGKDVRSRIVTSIKDPDSLKGQEERVSIDNVWFDSIELAKFTRGEIVEEEIPFGFTPSDVKYENVIK